MKHTIQAAVVVAVLACAAPAESGRRRFAAKMQVKSQQIAFRQSKLDSGVTLTRARTLMYGAQSVANVTGFFTPFGFIANVLGR